MAEIEAFADGAALAEAAAAVLAAALSAAGPRSFVATGGSSPGATYDRLSAADLDWPNISVTLSDERFVDPASPLSNARLVRERLLAGPAGAARLVPLRGQGLAPEADALAAEPAIGSLLPFAAVLLGMGEDGHVASLFPGRATAADMDPDGPRLCVGVEEAGLAPLVPRISLTVRALLTSRLVVLLIAGAAKRDLVANVLAGAAPALPVTAILAQDRAPARILWAP